MPIAPNPRSNTKAVPRDEDRKAAAFISKAAPADAEKATLKPIMIRFPVHILDRIDRAARQLGITRTAYIVLSTSEKLTKEEREAR